MKANISKLLYIVIILSLALILAICTACGDGGKKQGTVPILKVGDTWVSQGITEEIEYTSTFIVTGEEVVNGIDCYVVEVTNDPPVMGVSLAIINMDKATMDIISGQAQGEILGSSLVSDVTVNYEHSGQRYPLKEGNTWQTTENTSATTTYMDETGTETDQTTYAYEVEKIEEVTVAAGKFTCFKILQYDDSGSLLTTTWLSDETKHFNVKEINHVSGDETELISYSVSD